MSFKSFVTGFGVGVGAAALFAPKRGAELRKDLIDAASDQASTAREAISGVLRGVNTRQSSDHKSGTYDPQQHRATELAGGSNLATAPADGGFIARVNSARREELLAVYGIGPVIADQIIQNRPFRSEQELIERKIVPESSLDHLKRQLSSKRSA
jgi:gas vesicle protein